MWSAHRRRSWRSNGVGLWYRVYFNVNDDEWWPIRDMGDYQSAVDAWEEVTGETEINGHHNGPETRYILLQHTYINGHHKYDSLLASCISTYEELPF